MSVGSRERFAAAVRAEQVDVGTACLLMAAEFDEDLDRPGAIAAWTASLDALAAHVLETGSPADRLRAALGEFGGTVADYSDLRSSLLHEVLRRRHGLPILLSVVWTEVARRAGITAYGVGLPGHFVVGLAATSQTPSLLVDPFVGGAPVTRRPGAADARPWDAVATLERILANVRHWADRPERVPVRLKAVELALLLPRHATALRREHGELRVRCGDFLGGAAELEAYAEAVEPADPDTAAAARKAARSARARLN